MTLQQATAGAAPAALASPGARWRALGAIALLAACLALFWPTTASLIERWQNDATGSYDHGYLMVLMVAWLFWRNRVALSQAPVQFSPLAWIALLVCCASWLVVYRAGLQILHQGLLPLIVFLAFVSCYGLRSWQLGLPIAYLYFAVPLWDALNPVLQQASVWAVELLLAVIGIPAHFTGNTLTTPVGAFEIADGCSGLRFFIIGLAVAALYGELNRDTPRVRLQLCLLAAVLSMLVNWLRIVIIVVAGYLTDMQHYLVSREHISFGWVMFALTMALFFFIVRRWPLPPAEALPEASLPAQQAFKPASVALTIAAMLLAPAWLLLDKNRSELAQIETVLPAAVSGWSTASPEHIDWQPLFIGTDASEQAVFSADRGSVEAFAAIYLDQYQGKELISFNNSVTGESLRALRRAPGTGAWMEVHASDYSGEQWLLWSANRLDERWYDSALRLQLSYGIGSLFGAPVGDAIVLRARCASDDCVQARSLLTEFVSAAWPQSLAGRP